MSKARRQKKPSEWCAIWRFKSPEEAIAAIPELSISMGVGDQQFMSCDAESLEDGECLSLCGAGGEVDACLSFPYGRLKGKDAWISPNQIEKVQTIGLNGKKANGNAYRWGFR